MRFLQPEIMWNLLWILPAIIIIFMLAQQRRKKVLIRLLGAKAQDADYVRCSGTARFVRVVLLMLAVVCLLAAAARPVWGVSIQEVQGEGRDLLFVFDVSKSMLCKDVQPSRLQHSKWLVRQIVQANPGDRFGLIAFAGKAFLTCPLTTDRTSFLLNLTELNVDAIPVGGTNIQEALETAMRAFQGAETTHRAIIMISDGDELTGSSVSALESLKRRKIPLFVIGVGDPSQPALIQAPDENGKLHLLKDRSGNTVTAPLNEKMLASLAAGTNGIYVRSTAVDPGLSSIEKRIKNLVPKSYEARKTSKPIDRFMYPLAAALILLAIWMLLSERGKDMKSGKAMLAFAFLIVAGSIQAAPEEGTKVPEKPADPQILFNTALEAQQKNDSKTAAAMYEKALALGGSNAALRGSISQNMGVIKHTESRNILQKSQQSITAQKLDQAEKDVAASLKVMDEAEAFYREAMKDAPKTHGLSVDQTLLLADRKKAEQLKKQIEELKKMQQQAQKQTQQAKDQQKKQNQQDQSKQDQQNKQGQQNQKNQQDQSKQDQQNKQGQQNQKNQQDQSKQDQQNKQGEPDLKQQTKAASDSAQKLEKQARDLGQKNMADQAKKAKEEIDKARSSQEKGNGKEAEKHLDNALKHLGNPDQQNKQEPKDKSDQQKSGNKDQKQDQKLPQPQPDQQGQAQQAEPGKIDKTQAEALLNSMSSGEKDLQDALKKNIQMQRRNTPVEKDW